MRVYVPATLPLLRSWLADAAIPIATGYAVTPGLRAGLVGEEDELEYAAASRAARASLRLIGPTDPARRVVLAVDADDPQVLDHLDDGAVRLTAAVPLRAVAAGMIDGSAAEEAVRAAVEVIDAADLDDEGAELVVGDAEDHDLLWYATQELGGL